MISHINWGAIDQPTAPIRAEVQVRYRSSAALATVIPLDNGAARSNDEPQFDITLGQAVVWYNGDVVIGGGILIH